MLFSTTFAGNAKLVSLDSSQIEEITGKAKNRVSQAVVVRGDDDLIQALRALKVLGMRPVTFLGTCNDSKLTVEVQSRLNRFFKRIVQRYSEMNAQVCYLTGGTAAGIIRLFGQVHLESKSDRPLVGVAPGANLEKSNKYRTSFDADHTGGLIMGGAADWDSAALSLCESANVISGYGERRNIAYVAGGGLVTSNEIHHWLETNATVRILWGSGRFADDVAGVIMSSGNEHEWAEHWLSGKLQVLDIRGDEEKLYGVDPDAG